MIIYKIDVSGESRTSLSSELKNCRAQKERRLSWRVIVLGPEVTMRVPVVGRGLWGFNLQLTPKERTPRLSYQLG